MLLETVRSQLDYAVAGTPLRTLRETLRSEGEGRKHDKQQARGFKRKAGRYLRMVTNSSAELGWMPTTLSNCSFVAPILTATANPCAHVR